jgi:FtsZ-interacting cell division protein YlmF
MEQKKQEQETRTRTKSKKQEQEPRARTKTKKQEQEPRARTKTKKRLLREDSTKKAINDSNQSFVFALFLETPGLKTVLSVCDQVPRKLTICDNICLNLLTSKELFCFGSLWICCRLNLRLRTNNLPKVRPTELS